MCKQCSYRLQATSGTAFHRSHIPLHQWFRAIWWVVAQKNGVSAQGLKRILGLKSYGTAWLMLHKIRSLMVMPGREMLSGKVEVDETIVGGVHHGGKRGRGAEGKILVGVAVEAPSTNIGRIRLNILKNCEAKTLQLFVTTNVVEKSLVVTDGHRSYRGVPSWNYTHVVEQASVLDGEEILPNVHRVAALLKRWLLGTHQHFCLDGHLQAYLDEFVFRFNRRNSKSRGLLFDTLIKQAVCTQPLMYKDLINVSKQ
jgi:transposase-like protein